MSWTLHVHACSQQAVAPAPIVLFGLGIDAAVTDGDLFDFDVEVEPVLEELESLRRHQEDYEKRCLAELLEVQRMEAAEKRRRDEACALAAAMCPAFQHVFLVHVRTLRLRGACSSSALAAKRSLRPCARYVQRDSTVRDTSLHLRGTLEHSFGCNSRSPQQPEGHGRLERAKGHSSMPLTASASIKAIGFYPLWRMFRVCHGPGCPPGEGAGTSLRCWHLHRAGAAFGQVLKPKWLEAQSEHNGACAETCMRVAIVRLQIVCAAWHMRKLMCRHTRWRSGGRKQLRAQPLPDGITTRTVSGSLP
eukprot:6482553-Amphidinium_carterae.1